jgi:hypothetical protein
MGFIGLQTKGKLNGLPDAAAAAIFDNFNKASNEETPFGSLYRFGSIDPLVPLGQKLASARDKFSSLLNTTSNLDALKSLLDSALPGELSTTNFGDATA